MIERIFSGGQTGADRAALDAALALGIPIGGWCPKGRIAEDGRIPDCYPLKETPSSNYPQRTEWNVRDSDATVVFTKGQFSRGSALTLDHCRKHKKPSVHIDFLKIDDEGATKTLSHIICNFEDLYGYRLRTLNIAGSRESKAPGIYEQVKRLLTEVLR